MSRSRRPGRASRYRAGVARVLLLAGLAAALPGCSPSAQAPPEGFRAVRTPRVELAYPERWRQGHDPKAAHLAEWTGPGGARARIAVLERLGSATGAELVMALGQSSVQLLPGYRVARDRSVDVEGARSARRADYSYLLDEGRGRPRTPVQAIDLAMVDAARNPAVVRITWQAGALDAPAAERIAATVRMRRQEG